MNGKMITACNTDSPSMEGNGRIPLLWLTLLELLETSVKEEQPVVTYGMEKELTVKQNSSMVVGLKLLMSKIYQLMKVMLNQQPGRNPLG